MVFLNRNMETKQHNRYIPNYFKKEDKKVKSIEERKFQARKVEIEFDGVKTYRISVLPQ